MPTLTQNISYWHRFCKRNGRPPLSGLLRGEQLSRVPKHAGFLTQVRPVTRASASHFWVFCRKMNFGFPQMIFFLLLFVFILDERLCALLKAKYCQKWFIWGRPLSLSLSAWVISLFFPCLLLWCFPVARAMSPWFPRESPSGFMKCPGTVKDQIE